MNTPSVKSFFILCVWGKTHGICVAFESDCLLHPQEFDKESVSQGGYICRFFFFKRNETKSHCHMGLSVQPS